MTDEYEITVSPLCGSLTENGHTIRVEIYRGPDTDWSLEVVTENDTSIVWDDLFPTDQEALAELRRALREEGIEAIVGDAAT